MKNYTKRDPNSYWYWGKKLPETMPKDVVKLMPDMEWEVEDKGPKDWGKEIHRWPKKVVRKGRFKVKIDKGSVVCPEYIQFVNNDVYPWGTHGCFIAKQEITISVSYVTKVKNG